MKKLFIFIVSFVVLVGVFAPTIFAVAQESGKDLAPNNPLCWTKQACEDMRKEMVGDSLTESSGGWIHDPPCYGEYGKCLPAGVTKTQISFGGENKFTDAGQYIKKVYDYSIVIIGIIAVLVIIIAGIQWITSAGNSDAIISSQKRIKGAVIGLLIAYMSFNILNSVNPATTNFRLPQVWMVSGDSLERGVEVLEGDYCDPSGKDGETKASCEKDGTKKCFKVVRSDGGSGLCYKVAQGVAIFASGGVAATVLVGTAAGAAITTGITTAGRAGTIITKFAARISLKMLKRIGYKAVINTAKVGTAAGIEKVTTGDANFTLGAVKLGAGIVALGATAGTASIYDYMTEDEEKDFKENRNGICLDKIKNNLRNGQMCNTDGNQCESGVCISLKTGLECWQSSENGKMGICSDGAVGSICNSDNDCNTKTNPKMKCTKTVLGLKYCGDGSANSPCTVGDQCNSGICNKNKCVDKIGEKGDWCSSNQECSPEFMCWAIMDCGPNVTQPINCGNQCQTWDLDSDVLYEGVEAYKTGVCLDSASFTLVKQKLDYAHFAPASGGTKCE